VPCNEASEAAILLVRLVHVGCLLVMERLGDRLVVVQRLILRSFLFLLSHLQQPAANELRRRGPRAVRHSASG
jgi:hypothetical protein